MKQIKQNNGFTLIELSIVIVIIGLIVAGVVGGQALVNNAKLRTITSELNQAKIQLNTFYLEYNAFPGDIPNAYDYWGTSCDATPSNCNGNGDKRVEYNSNVNNNEVVRYWQHLGLSGIINKTFDGIGDMNDCDEFTCYYSKTNKAKYLVAYHQATHRFRTPPIPSRSLVMRLSIPDGTVSWWNPALTVPDAYKIDTKIDDGIANQGQFLAYERFGPGGCSAHKDTAGGADYVQANLSDKTTIRCLGQFIIF